MSDMPSMVCITHDWVLFMEADGKMIVRCTECGLKKGREA